MKIIKNIICVAGLAGGLFAPVAVMAGGQVGDKPADPNATSNNASATPKDTAPSAVAKPADAANQTPQPPSENAPGPEVAVPQPAQASAPAQTPAPAQAIPTATVSAHDAGTNRVADYPPGQGLRFNFRGVELEQVLDYMSKSADFVINVSRGVDVRGKVNVWSEQPLSKDEAVDLLQKILNQNGYSVIRDKRILTIMSSAQARSNEGTPVGLVTDYKQLERDTMTVTEIIPVHSLNPVQLVKDLKDMLPQDSIIVPNESANALIMTDTRANIRRIADIVATLDSVTSGVNTLQVFSLQYADAKSVADMIKDLFPSQDNNRNGSGGIFGTRFGRSSRSFFGGFGGFPGGPGGESGGDNSGNGQTPSLHIGAVADDHSNSVIVSAPESLMGVIENMIKEIDIRIDAVTELKVFKLKHADAVETAELLNNLYTDESSASDAAHQNSSSSSGLRSYIAARYGIPLNNNNNESSRAKLMGRVNAQPDPRTGSVVVSAAKELMPDIENMVAQLDNDSSRIVQMHLIHIDPANAYNIMQVMNDVFPRPAGLASSSANNATANDVMQNREKTITQQQNTSTATQNTTFGGTPGR